MHALKAANWQLEPPAVTPASVRLAHTWIIHNTSVDGQGIIGVRRNQRVTSCLSTQGSSAHLEVSGVGYLSTPSVHHKPDETPGRPNR